MNALPEIIGEIIGQYGVLTLNRPSALNALNPAMIGRLRNELTQWSNNPNVQAVIVRAMAGATAFCAGGDVRFIYQNGRDGNSAAIDFLREEYRLNHFIHHYPKPYIALMDGIVMGGGAGISIHGQYRIVTEKTIFSMPETAIGFVPDIGSSWFLNRCPEPFGLYLAMTGDRVGADALCANGLATDYIPSDHIEAFYSQIISEPHKNYQNILSAYRQPPPEYIKPDWLNCFKAATPMAVIDQCAQTESANRITELLRSRAPISLAVTFSMMHQMRHQSIENCLNQEFKIVQGLLKNNDFYEGVRAVLIDKYNKPRWSNTDLSTVDGNRVAMILDHSWAETLVFSD